MAVAFTAMLLASPAPAGAYATAATVTSPDGVNLRAGPGTNFPIFIVMPLGAVVTVIGDDLDGNWLPVTYNNLAGFAKGDFLTPIGAGQGGPTAALSPTPAPAATPAPGVATASMAASPQAGSPAAALMQFATVTPPDGLNLRGGPGTNFPVVMTTPGGARVQVVGRANADGWYSVVYNEKMGWVDGKYLLIGPAAAPVPTPAPAAPLGPPSPAVAAPSSAGFIWPVASRRISTLYSASHPGIDIDEFPSGGNPVVAIADGTVTFAGGTTCCSYGLYVIVTHAGGYSSLYSHLSSIGVSDGQVVRQGTAVGKSGSTGFSTGAHLHLEIRKDGGSVNPLPLLGGAYTIE